MAYPQIRRVLPLPQTAPQFAMQTNPPAAARPVGGMSSTTTQEGGQQQQGGGGSPMNNIMTAMRMRKMLAGNGSPIAGASSSSTVSGYGAVAPAGGDLGMTGSNGRVLQTITSPNAEPGVIGSSPPSTGMPEVTGSQGRMMGGSVSPYNEMPVPANGPVTMSELPPPSEIGMNAGGEIGGAEGGGGELLGEAGGGGGGIGSGGMMGPEIGMSGAEMYGPSMAEMGGAEAAGVGASEGAAAAGGAAGGSMASLGPIGAIAGAVMMGKGLEQQNKGSPLGHALNGLMGPDFNQVMADPMSGVYTALGAPWLNAFFMNDEAQGASPEWAGLFR